MLLKYSTGPEHFLRIMPLNYAPDKIQGNNKKDFVGWTGLAPIAVLIEYVFGIRADVPDSSLTWDIRMTDEFGISQLPYGKDGLIKLYCQKRKNLKEEPQVKISSNVSFKLNLIWAGGKKVIGIKPGNL